MSTDLKEAGLFRRFLAFVIDLAIILIPFGILSSLVSGPYMGEALGNTSLRDDLSEYLLDTGLFLLRHDEETGETLGAEFYNYRLPGDDASASTDGAGFPYDELPEGKEAYESYFEMTWHYVTEVLPTYVDDDRFQAVGYSLANGEEAHVGDYASFGYLDYFAQNFLELPSREAVGDATDEKSRAGESQFFAYALNEGGTAVDFSARPVLQAEYQAKVDAGDADTLESLALYFLDTSEGSYEAMGVYGKAIAMSLGQDEGKSQTYYASIQNKMSINSWLSNLVVYLPFAFIVFFLVPALSKDLRTPGKWILRLSVCTLDGYKVGVKERILRSSYMFVLNSLAMLPWSWTIFLYLILLLVEYMYLVLSKSKQSIHDKLTHTLEVDARGAIIFKDEEEKENYMNLHPELFPGYKSAAEKAEDEHIALLDSILDLSTIDKNRIEARSIVSFDEYEKSKGEEFDAALKRLAEQKEKGYSVLTRGNVDLHKEEDVDAVEEEKPMSGPEPETAEDKLPDEEKPVDEDELLGE